MDIHQGKLDCISCTSTPNRARVTCIECNKKYVLLFICDRQFVLVDFYINREYSGEIPHILTRSRDSRFANLNRTEKTARDPNTIPNVYRWFVAVNKQSDPRNNVPKPDVRYLNYWLKWLEERTLLMLLSNSVLINFIVTSMIGSNFLKKNVNGENVECLLVLDIKKILRFPIETYVRKLDTLKSIISSSKIDDYQKMLRLNEIDIVLQSKMTVKMNFMYKVHNKFMT